MDAQENPYGHILSQRAELETHMTIIDLTPEELAQFQDKTMDVVDMVRERAGNEIVDTLMTALVD
ncbi:hypothetical protein FF80_03126 [Devosia sp. LC5]|nr:hypothetical protein FF80_03126 [Devosia sp. LC5]